MNIGQYRANNRFTLEGAFRSKLLPNDPLAHIATCRLRVFKHVRGQLDALLLHLRPPTAAVLAGLLPRLANVTVICQACREPSSVDESSDCHPPRHHNIQGALSLFPAPTCGSSPLTCGRYWPLVLLCEQLLVVHQLIGIVSCADTPRRGQSRCRCRGGGRLLQGQRGLCAEGPVGLGCPNLVRRG